MRTLRWRWKAEWGEKKECRRGRGRCAALDVEGGMGRKEGV